MCNGPRVLQVQVASDHALMLLNKCRAKLRSLQSLQQSRLKLCHNIASTQHHAANTARHTHSPLTPYELSLLKSGDKLRRHCDSLQEAARIAAECNTTQHHVRMFFEWLGTVSQEQKGSLLASDPHHAQVLAPCAQFFNHLLTISAFVVVHIQYNLPEV